MFIQEAAQIANEVDGYIVRRRDMRRVRIRPTDSSDGCILITKHNPLCPRWQPKAEDLMADDWTVTTEELT